MQRLDKAYAELEKIVPANQRDEIIQLVGDIVQLQLDIEEECNQ
jgi:hypothetical protein